MARSDQKEREGEGEREDGYVEDGDVVREHLEIPIFSPRQREKLRAKIKKLKKKKWRRKPW